MTSKLNQAVAAALAPNRPASTPVLRVLRALPALALGLAAVPAAAQLCDPLDPPFLAEGPITAVASSGGGSGTIRSLGVTFEVRPETTIHTPTKALTMDQFASTAPFPGRTQAGFMGATVIAEGCVKEGPNGPFAVAEDVSSDVNENVLLGVVTAPWDAAGGFGVDGTQARLLTDARMPAHPIMNEFGFEVTPESLDLGRNVALEGYYSNDGSGVLHVWSVEADGGTLVHPADPQISIQRFDCAGDIELRGGIYLANGGTCTFGAPHSIALRDGSGNLIPYQARDLTVTNGAVPSPEFCAYRLRPRVAQCPASVKVELLRDGLPIASATAP